MAPAGVARQFRPRGRPEGDQNNLTRRRLNRYYNALTMTSSGLHAYVPLLIHLLVAMVLAGALLAAQTRPSCSRMNVA